MYWLTGIAGLLLADAPWIFDYSGNTTATWVSIIIGIATIVVSWIEGTQNDRGRWEYWTSVILGLVAIAAPFIFGFNKSLSALWSSEILGILVIIFAGGRLFSL